MRLLAVEARQDTASFLARYRQVEEFGAELSVLVGDGVPERWHPDRYRVLGSAHVGDIVGAAREWHLERDFDGVVTFSETGVVTVAAVAEALGLPGVGVAAARTSRNRLLMRLAHEAGGAPHPRFRFATELAEALAAADELAYPVTLRPTLGTGDNFAFRADSPAELRLRFPEAAAGLEVMSWFETEAEGVDLGPQGLLVESCPDGHEVLVEAVVWDGEVYLGSVVDRLPDDGHGPDGHGPDDDMYHAPTALPAEHLEAVRAAVAAGARAQGLRHSVLHAVVRFGRQGPYLRELTLRPGGGGLDMIARLTADYCPVRAATDVARGVRPRLRHYRPTGVHVAARYIVGGGGQIAEITVPALLAAADRVFSLKITARPGRQPQNGTNVLGFLGTTGTSFDDLADRIHVKFADRGAD